MKEKAQALLDELTKDYDRLQGEVSKGRAFVQRCEADLIATNGAIQALKKVLEDEPKTPA